MKKRLKNETGEPIEIPPGEAVDIIGDMVTERLMAKRRDVLIVEGIE